MNNKWKPFNSLVNTNSLAKELAKNKEKVSRPILSADDEELIESKLINSYFSKTSIIISYYEFGYIRKIKGIIKKIDKVNKLIYLNNKRLLFSQIIAIKEV